MAQTIDFTGNNLSQPFTRKAVDTDAILHAPGNRPREKSAEILKKMGIHPDYIEAAVKGEPFGAKVIDLAEYRWMRKFDEL